MPYGVNTPACGGLGQPRCGGSIDNILSGSGVGLGSVWNFPSTNNGSTRSPNATVTNAGISIQNTTLDKTLNAILSGLALLKGADKIPTTLDPSDSYGGGRGYSPAELALLQSQYQGGGGNTAGKVENWIKNNTGATVVIALVGAALFLPPLTGSKKR